MFYLLLCYSATHHVLIRMFGLQHLRDLAQTVFIGLLWAGLEEGYSDDSLCNVVEVEFRSLRHHNAVHSCEEIYTERETGFSSIMCRTTTVRFRRQWCKDEHICKDPWKICSSWKSRRSWIFSSNPWRDISIAKSLKACKAPLRPSKTTYS